MGEALNTDQMIRIGIKRVSERSIPVLSKFMGLMLLVYAMLFIYSRMNKVSDGTIPFTNAIGIIIVMTCSFLILIDFSFNLNRTIGLYAIAIGGNRFFKFVNYLFMDGGSGEIGQYVTIGFFIFGIIMVVTSMNLCYTGVVFLKGQTRGRVSMSITSMLMLVVTIVFILAMAQINSTGVLEAVRSMPDMTAMIFLYILLICILGTKKIRDTDLNEHYVSILNGIRHTESTSDGAFIHRSTAKELVESYRNRETWKQYDDDGPVESEYCFKLINRIDDISYVRVQKWKDDDTLYFTVSDKEDGSMINAYRFTADDIGLDGPIETCGFLYIRSDRTQMKIAIKNDPEVKKWGLKYA